MAKYQITRTCGHVETVNIVGPGKDRPRKAAREANRLCHACYVAEQQAAAIAAAPEVSADLPALTGSAKQITWADALRASGIVELGTATDMFRDADYLAKFDDETRSTILRTVADYEAEVTAETSAGWWIDRRDSLTANAIGHHLANLIRIAVTGK